MRTTLTLDDDVATKLKTEARRTGRPLRDVVNETLRLGLISRRQPRALKPFKVVTRDLGEVTAGLSFDNVADLLEQVEGPFHR